MEAKLLPDHELVENSLKGSKESLETLIARYHDYVYNISYKMLWNIADAQDITQEILITVITKLDSFKQERAFKTWLFRIAKNHILNDLKSKERRIQFSFEEYGNNLDNTPDFALEQNAYANTEN